MFNYLKITSISIIVLLIGSTTVLKNCSGKTEPTAANT